MALRAGVERVATENSQVLLELPPGRMDLSMRDLGPEVRRSKRGIWLAMQSDDRWKDRLLEVLERLP